LAGGAAASLCCLFLAGVFFFLGVFFLFDGFFFLTNDGPAVSSVLFLYRIYSNDLTHDLKQKMHPK